MLKKISLATVGAVFIGLGVGGAVEAATFEVLASGLDNPRDITFGTDGALYVTEAGRGGTGACIPSPSQPGENICYGSSGAVTRIENGTSERVVTGLPSLAFANGTVGYGIHDIAFNSNGKAYGIIGLASNPAERDNKPGFANFAQLISFDNFNGGASWTNLADLGAYERSNNPDGTEVDTNPYSLLIQGDTALVVDSGANDLLRVALDGSEIAVQSVFDERLVTDPSGQDNLLQSVPTSIETGPDDAYYVSEFTGFPYPEDAARIYRIGANNEPETYADGFTNVIDFAFDTQGNLYVLELADGSLASGDRTGALIRVASDGTRTTIASDELVTPTALELGPDGDIYVSNYGLFAGQGQVIRFEGTTPVPEPSSVLGVLAFAALGISVLLKRKRKQLAQLTLKKIRHV